MYQVWLGSEHQQSSCQCIDYRMKKLLCKHICAIVRQPGVGWEFLGSRFANRPLFTLDQEVTQVAPILVDDSELPSDVEKCTSSCNHTSTSMASSSTHLNHSLSKQKTLEETTNLLLFPLTFQAEDQISGSSVYRR